MIAERVAEVRVRRHSNVPDCEVMVAFRCQEISIRRSGYDKAVKWARSNISPIRW